MNLIQGLIAAGVGIVLAVILALIIVLWPTIKSWTKGNVEKVTNFKE